METEPESIAAWLAHHGAGLTKMDCGLTSCRSQAGLDSLLGTTERDREHWCQRPNLGGHRPSSVELCGSLGPSTLQGHCQETGDEHGHRRDLVTP